MAKIEYHLHCMAPAVVTVVREAGEPAPTDEEMIAELQRLMDQGGGLTASDPNGTEGSWLYCSLRERTETRRTVEELD